MSSIDGRGKQEYYRVASLNAFRFKSAGRLSSKKGSALASGQLLTSMKDCSGPFLRFLNGAFGRLKPFVTGSFRPIADGRDKLLSASCCPSRLTEIGQKSRG